MRKLLLCVPMMTLLLAGCGAGGVSEAEQLALTIRGEYLGMESCTAQASVTADSGCISMRWTSRWRGRRRFCTSPLRIPCPGLPPG